MGRPESGRAMGDVVMRTSEEREDNQCNHHESIRRVVRHELVRPPCIFKRNTLLLKEGRLLLTKRIPVQLSLKPSNPQTLKPYNPKSLKS